MIKNQIDLLLKGCRWIVCLGIVFCFVSEVTIAESVVSTTGISGNVSRGSRTVRDVNITGSGNRYATKWRVRLKARDHGWGACCGWYNAYLYDVDGKAIGIGHNTSNNLYGRSSYSWFDSGERTVTLTRPIARIRVVIYGPWPGWALYMNDGRIDVWYNERNPNSAPTNISLSQTSVDENQATNSTVGTLSNGITMCPA